MKHFCHGVLIIQPTIHQNLHTHQLNLLMNVYVKNLELRI